MSDFCSTITLFNETVQKCPPPGNKLIWVLSIWILWIIAIVSNYLIWVYTRSSYGLVVLPFFMILTTVLFVWRHRVLRRRVVFYNNLHCISIPLFTHCYYCSLKKQLSISVIESMQQRIYEASITGSVKTDPTSQT